ncbi:hypothetical protein [Cytobacillus sp. IB215665]|uniref:hypothetical protein n=1 Tax=Cytobacillus sp. IB215665 TaxID=3097357 RepID=UPI002A172D0D|nr:hypothetical protein [Cytobacillus sp. IB215665]MDX8366905.1 hypothetical protein [Cytobacillus sp. IB215665]
MWTRILPIVLLFVLVGCKNDIHSKEQVEITKLKEQVALLEERLNEKISADHVSDLIDSKVEEIKVGVKDSYLLDNQKLEQLEHLITKLPSIKIITGFITDLDSDNLDKYITIDAVNYLSGEEAIQAVMDDGNVSREEVFLPNGFYIQNQQVEQINYWLSSDLLLYIADGNNKNYTEDLNMLIEPYERLFYLYINNHEVIMIEEQYLP